MWTGSNYGDPVEIAAPGANIYSTVFGNDYHSYNGTSAAAPMVAGVAGLIYGANPNYTYDQVKGILTQTSETFCVKQSYTYPIVNAKKAVEWALEQRPHYPDIEQPRFGFVTGLVQDASTLSLIDSEQNNASVLITNEESQEQYIAPIVEGVYECALSPGNYTMEFFADGYVSETIYHVRIEEGLTEYNVLLNMVTEEPGTGRASGQIINAFDASAISGATIEVFHGVNQTSGTPLQALFSDSYGRYSLELDPGNYTIRVRAEGFQDGKANILIVSGTDHADQNCSLTPMTVVPTPVSTTVPTTIPTPIPTAVSTSVLTAGPIEPGMSAGVPQFHIVEVIKGKINSDVPVPEGWPDIQVDGSTFRIRWDEYSQFPTSIMKAGYSDVNTLSYEDMQGNPDFAGLTLTWSGSQAIIQATPELKQGYCELFFMTEEQIRVEISFCYGVSGYYYPMDTDIYWLDRNFCSLYQGNYLVTDGSVFRMQTAWIANFARIHERDDTIIFDDQYYIGINANNEPIPVRDASQAAEIQVILCCYIDETFARTNLYHAYDDIKLILCNDQYLCSDKDGRVYLSSTICKDALWY